jgi:hypothetical protein
MGDGDGEPEPMVVERKVMVGADAATRLDGMGVQAICGEAAELEVKMEVCQPGWSVSVFDDQPCVCVCGSLIQWAMLVVLMQALAHEDRKRAELEKAERRQMSEEQRERCGTALLHCTILVIRVGLNGVALYCTGAIVCL